MTQSSGSQSLYDRDLNLWAETTVAQLQAHWFDEVNWEAVIKEIIGFGSPSSLGVCNSWG